MSGRVVDEVRARNDNVAARWGLYKSVRSATVVRPRAQVAMALVLAERHLDAALRRPTDAAAVAVFVAFARMLYSFRETFSLFLHLLVSAATAGSGAGTSRTPRRSQQTTSPL